MKTTETENREVVAGTTIKTRIKVKMMRYIMPTPYIYECPKDNRYIKADVCEKCEYYNGGRHYRGTWVVMCDYPTEIEEDGGI